MNQFDESGEPGVSAEAVRAQLARILQSSALSHAPALCRMLRHVVERTLQGSADVLKEYALGVDVFDRGQSFDPATDTIVRVQARRLRSKLAEYYRSEGKGDPVLVQVPTGGYAATFRVHRMPRVSEDAQSAQITGSHPTVGLFAPTESARHTLPAPRTTLIGRERELDAVTQLLRDAGVRLLTLTGAGGAGKTRLALEACLKVADQFDGGVLMLPIAPLSDRAAVVTALVQLLGLRHTGGKPVREALREHVRHRITTPTLLMLDNFEHVIDAASSIVDVLEASSHAKVVVTSRTVLHIYGEHEYAVPPLEVPGPESGLPELERSPAIRLFAERARASDPSFAITAINASTVARICRRLDGLPLAIELAAARIKLFPPEAMLQRLAHSLDFLTGGPCDVPARQQALRNTVDWSHALLTNAEQRLFRRLAVFAGGWTLEGAEAVCDAYRDLGVDVVSGMDSLVKKSLVEQIGSFGGEARFNMLETLREYAWERLAASGDEISTRRAHAAYCIVLAEEGNPARTVTERGAWLARCDVEQDNFRRTLDWLLATKNAEWALRLGQSLFGFWEPRELLVEARQWLQAIVDLRCGSTATSAWSRAVSYTATICDTQGDRESASGLHQQALDAYKAAGNRKGEAAQLNALAVQHQFMGRHGLARSFGERALEVCRELGDQPEVAAALSNLALAVSREGDFRQACVYIEEARAIFESLGDEVSVLWSVNRLGDVARQRGDLTEARRLYKVALDGFVRLEDPWGSARSAADLAQVSTEMDDCAAAHALFAQALATFSSIDHKRGIARVLEGFAVLAEHERQYERALTLAGAAAAIRHAFGAAPREADQAALERRLERAWQSSPTADTQRIWKTGARLSLDEAIRFALT